MQELSKSQIDREIIRDLETEIRDFITNPRRQDALVQDHAKWNRLTSSLDVIGDTELAFEAFSATPDPAEDGARYLLIYGVLQALYVQQDALRHLVEAFGQKFDVNPKLDRIRQIRNITAGHPTSTRNNQSHFLSRFSMTKHGYKLLTTKDDGSCEFHDVDLDEVLKQQRGIVREVLKNTMDALRQEDLKHRLKFKDQRLVDIFSGTEYLVGKITEYCGSGSASRLTMAEAAAETICSQVSKFKTALEERGVLNDAGDLNYHFEEIEYPLASLDNYVHGRESDVNEKSGRIFAYFVGHKLEELREMAEEIDREYLEGLEETR